MLNDEHDDFALRAANLAVTGRQRREAHSFASIELRQADPDGGGWEMAAVGIIGLGAALCVLGVWFL